MDLPSARNIKLLKDLRYQVAFFALIPPFLTAFSIGIYLHFSFPAEEKARQINRVTVSLKQISHIISLSKSDEKLTRLILTENLEIDGLKAIGVFNQSGEEINHAGLNFKYLIHYKSQLVTQNQTFIEHHDKTTLIAIPIRQHKSIKTHLLNKKNALRHGWIVGEFYHHQFDQFMQLHQFRQNMILFIALIIAIFLSYLFYQRLTQEIKNIKKNMKLIELKEGNATSFSHFIFDEFSQIDQEIKKLHKEKEHEIEDMKANIELTSGDLQQTIETIEVQNIELSLAQKEAIKANKMKSEFLANTSHELRTPLNGIIGFTRMLQKTAITIRQREYLDTIMVSAEGLLTIINDILDFSKIEANKLELEKTPVNLRYLLEDVVGLLAPSAFEKKVDIVLFIYQDVPLQVISDPLRLKQIFYNLIANAIKFTQKGEVIVRIELINSLADKVEIRCQVTDTGIGMTSQQQKELFDAFYQADTSRAREYGGTGLGLTIAKALIDLFGGSIKVQSQIESGTTFSFNLNLSYDHVLTENEKPFTSYQVGLLEPHETSRLVLTHMLEGFGFTVKHINLFEKIEETIALHMIDALIIGFSATDTKTDIDLKIKLLNPLNKTPTIILQPFLTSTALNESSHLISCNKPVKEVELLKQCKQILLNNQVISHELIEPHSRHNKKILIADDNEANLKLLKIILQELNCTVISAQNGIEAIEKAQRNQPDLIFMDIQMPFVNGIEASESIREFSDIPIIALTAHIEDDNRKTLSESGINDCLTKPIDEREIQSCLNTFFPTVTIDSNNVNPKDEIVCPIDFKHSISLAKGKPDIALEMLSLLLKGIPHCLKVIQSFETDGNLSTLYDEVHKLHGAACYTSVKGLKPLCVNLENSIKHKEIEDIAAQTEKLKSLFTTLLQWAQDNEVSTYFQQAETS